MHYFSLLFIALLAFSSCKTKHTKPTTGTELSENVDSSVDQPANARLVQPANNSQAQPEPTLVEQVSDRTEMQVPSNEIVVANSAAQRTKIAKVENNPPSAPVKMNTENLQHLQRETSKPAPKKIQMPEPVAQTQVPPSTSPRRAPDTPVAENKKPAPTKTTKPEHSFWNALLQTFVTNEGLVDYEGIKRNVSRLDEYLDMLENNPVQPDWSNNEKLAYWINAYNAYTVKMIVKNYPVGSIRDLHGGETWDVKWIELGGEKLSLNNIEHDIIRKEFDEPRIHFAVVCAALSCPPLANEAFTASNLKSLLEKRTTSFINNPKFNKTGEGKISEIFNWYGKDFGDVRAYVNKYAKQDLPSGKDISFLDYDWGLNKQ